MRYHSRWLISVTLLASVCAGHPDAAAADPPSQLTIVSASADFSTGILTVEGQNFGDGQPVVTLNGTPLLIVTATASEIMANLPPGLAQGTYLLTVSRGPATTESDAFNVTIGAAGPQGPIGATGPQGPAGTFTGHFQSPNGAFSLDVTDTGIKLSGPGATVQIAGNVVTITAVNVTIRSDAITAIQSGALTDIRGGTITLNGSGQPAARVGDAVSVFGAAGTIIRGSGSVFIGN